MDNSSVKKNISAIRKSLGLTQQEMAEKIGISRNAYRRIEAGSTTLLNDYIIRIASILDKTPAELVLGYVPHESGDRTLDEMRMQYLKEKEETERENRKMEQTVRSMEERIALLEDLVKTKDEIISMLKKEMQE